MSANKHVLKPQCCPECGKRFGTAEELQEHMGFYEHSQFILTEDFKVFLKMLDYHLDKLAALFNGDEHAF